MLTDDLPWPELGNVSRGATRGNQGAKGSLGPPDTDGRCVLQLRVQPGVLAVKLNRRSSEWYRILDAEVQNALKETKTFWRKARRRQDYDPRADQDHMELHEWLQQLKDKVMSQLELLMQKGDIQGPPYVMPDHLEFAFMRKFIERHSRGVPHNPRLRGLGLGPGESGTGAEAGGSTRRSTHTHEPLPMAHTTVDARALASASTEVSTSMSDPGSSSGSWIATTRSPTSGPQFSTTSASPTPTARPPS